MKLVYSASSCDMHGCEIYDFEERFSLKVPLALAPVPAGFPSPADDYIDKKLDLNEYLIPHPAATYFMRVKGDSMVNAGIHSGDILIVDRAVEAADKKVVIAFIDGEMTVKRIRRSGHRLYLMPENPEYDPIQIGPEQDFELWGVVTHVIHPL